MAAESVSIIIRVAGEDPLKVDLDPGAYALGREESCELLIENDGISRRHALITVAEAGVTAEDLGSSNGSSLDGEPLVEPRAFAPGQTLVLGADAITITFAVPEAESGSAESAEFSGTMARAAPPEAAEEPDPPAEVNLFDANYHFLEEIARGGMGAVIEAEDLNTGRTVAIKKMLTEGEASEESKHRFLQEARVMGHLEHPNIVPMHELGLNEAGMPYYTMKRIQGTDPQDILTAIKQGHEPTIAAHPRRTRRFK